MPVRLVSAKQRPSEAWSLTRLLSLIFRAAGDWAQGFHTWSERFVASAQGFNNVKPIEGQSPAIALSLLGLTGITAYCGLHFVGQVKKENTVVISAAAGATGSVAVQLAKNVVGCKKVIGIAGGEKKCRAFRLTHPIETLSLTTFLPLISLPHRLCRVPGR